MADTNGQLGVRYTWGEEVANALTHGFGAVLSVAGLGVLVSYAAAYGTAWHVVSFTVFGATLVILYAASTAYHALPEGAAKRAFRVLDHSAIYLLIAGTYTPFVLVSLRGAWGWSLFAVVWACAVLGIVLKHVCFARFQKASVALYAGMGWLSLVAARQVVAHVPGLGFWLLLGGGLVYTFGLVFYLWRRPYHHAVWHAMVLSGSALHFFSVMSTLGAG
jgi:hemolysin III